MAMNGIVLGDVIAAIVGAGNPALITANKPMWEAIATAIVTHIQTNAIVSPGVTLIAPGGLSPAPCTGFGTIT